MQNEKIKVLSAIRDINKNDVVRGQFEGFLDEDGVAERFRYGNLCCYEVVYR